MKLIIEAATI